LSRLSDATLVSLPSAVIRPAYDRGATRIGVVHFGPGAFHRAHQAFYLDRMLTRDPGLAICAVSLHSDAVRAALEPQDGLYSLIEREAEPQVRIIGAIRQILTAPRDPGAVFARLVDPALRLVTATVTEKGYCLTPAGDLDADHPDIRHDLASPDAPRSFIGWLTEGLRRRHAAGAPGIAALSCDNLSGNGARLRRAVLQFAQARGDADLVRWIEREITFPDTMVDSITPATDDALRAEVARRLGLTDAWPIQRERFAQWVVGEGLSAKDAAIFAEAGVTLAADVAAFERAKLRLLNGAHSTLAYVGLARGHATVAEAMADPTLAAFVEAMMREDIAASLKPAAGLDVPAYIGQILARFRNPAIVHRLSQIAWDGSQKLPVRLLETLAEARAAGRPIARLAVGVAAWMVFVRTQARARVAIVDPLADRLTAIGLGCTGDPTADIGRFLQLDAVFPRALAADGAVRAALATAYASPL
jgi:fructuronate reductase